jgi:hypothetical protein
MAPETKSATATLCPPERERIAQDWVDAQSIICEEEVKAGT